MDGSLLPTNALTTSTQMKTNRPQDTNPTNREAMITDNRVNTDTATLTDIKKF